MQIINVFSPRATVLGLWWHFHWSLPLSHLPVMLTTSQPHWSCLPSFRHPPINTHTSSSTQNSAFIPNWCPGLMSSISVAQHVYRATVQLHLEWKVEAEPLKYRLGQRRFSLGAGLYFSNSVDVAFYFWISGCRLQLSLKACIYLKGFDLQESVEIWQCLLVNGRADGYPESSCHMSSVSQANG